MKLSKFAMSFVCFAAMAVSAFAADVTGKWTATMEGRNGQTREMTYNLKADGDKLTGNVATQRGEREIENGKISGDEISFTMTTNMGGESRKMMYTGKLSGDDELKMTMKMDGSDNAREFTAKRVK